MLNTYYVYDSSQSKLFVFSTEDIDDDNTEEGVVKAIAENNDLMWSNCQWGGVRHMDVGI